MKQIWIFCILMLTIQYLIATSEETIVKGGDGRYQACGRFLAHLLQVTCQSRYNTPVMRKRSVSPPLPEALENSNTVIGMLLPKEKAKAALQFRRRVKREGVYDECCRKSCTYVELRNYCAS